MRLVENVAVAQSPPAVVGVALLTGRSRALGRSPAPDRSPARARSYPSRDRETATACCGALSKMRLGYEGVVASGTDRYRHNRCMTACHYPHFAGAGVGVC